MSATLNEQLSATYNETPYYSYPFQQTVPEYLSAIATLFNVQSVPIENARILEIGCATGGNIIPMALRLPYAQFTGVDLSEVQIAKGQNSINQLGLNNISLHAMDLSHITPEFGTFDYIIAHGVYSWIPDEVKAALLHLCNMNLSKNGLVYISYNTYPGWKYREVIRDAMLFQGSRGKTPQEKLRYARGMINFLHDKSDPDGITKKNIDETLPLIKNAQDSHVIHEFLENHNDPCYFHEFVTRAQHNGLYYLAESHLPGMFFTNFAPEIIEPLLRECNGSQIAVEQYLDFLTGRSFRQTILLKTDRASEINYQLINTQLQKLHYAGIFTSRTSTSNHEPLKFTTLNNTEIQITHPIAMISAQILNEQYPSTLQIAELAQLVHQQTQRTEQPENLETCLDTVTLFIESMIIKGAVRVRSHTIKLATTVSNYPTRDKTACDILLHDDIVTNAWHEAIKLNIVEKIIWPLLDGQHNQSQLHAHLMQSVALGQLTLSKEGKPITNLQEISIQAQEHLNASLRGLKHYGLLARDIS